MTYGSPELGRGEVLEHGTTRGGRWLRERRIRIALWIAVVEGILIVLDRIPWSLAILVAIVAVAGYFWGRDRLSDTTRQVAWIAAASQAVVIFVPILLTIATVLAFTVLAIIAIVALLVLLGDRR
jgi:hypothetical protein